MQKLLLLNNIHGAFAVTSALLSHSIFRLNISWTKVGRHEKSIFDKLKRLFAADNNWENLRKLTDSRKIPCIPHIGIYLTDLMFIQNAMKQKHIPLALGERGVHQSNMDSLIRTLASFQDSHYGLFSIIFCFQSLLQKKLFPIWRFKIFSPTSTSSEMVSEEKRINFTIFHCFKNPRMHLQRLETHRFQGFPNLSFIKVPLPKWILLQKVPTISKSILN